MNTRNALKEIHRQTYASVIIAISLCCISGCDDCNKQLYYKDYDQDGYGVPKEHVYRCTRPIGYVEDNTDCDDSDDLVNEKAKEICDNKDNDCDGVIDNVDDMNLITFYYDEDNDTYGDSWNAKKSCIAPVGYVRTGFDCNDADKNINPAADEICDGKDNDCDGMIDESDAIGARPWYGDVDGDGYGDNDKIMTACEQPLGYVKDSSDCDDLNSNRNPGRLEISDDGIDQDCNGYDMCKGWYEQHNHYSIFDYTQLSSERAIEDWEGCSHIKAHITIEKIDAKIQDVFRDVKIIEGNLQLSGDISTPYEDLGIFPQLEHVIGDFEVEHTHYFTGDHTGFPMLKIIDGDLIVNNNDNLRSIRFLSSLVRVSGLEITNNNELYDIEDLFVDWSFHIDTFNHCYNYTGLHSNMSIRHNEILWCDDVQNLYLRIDCTNFCCTYEDIKGECQ